MRNSASVCPVRIGNAPVPIVACVAGVIDGLDPTLASSNQTPSSISERRTGQSSGNVSRTFRPAASQTSVTISAGGTSETGISGIASPSGASKSNPSSDACVGGMSAIVTGRSTTPRPGTIPGPYQNSGTSCR
jgi:hypothetical protein